MKDGESRLLCSVPAVSRDTLVVECASTPIGVMRFVGTFADKQGRFWNRPDISGGQRVVLSGVLTVVAGGRTVLSRRVEFVYREGD